MVEKKSYRSLENMKNNKKINIILTNEHKSDGFKSLIASGMIIHHYPMIRTSKKTNYQPHNLNDYDSFIFTSRNGVRFFFDMTPKIFIPIWICAIFRISKDFNSIVFAP